MASNPAEPVPMKADQPPVHGFEPLRPQGDDPRRWIKFPLFLVEYDLLKDAYERVYGKKPQGDDLSIWCFAIVAAFIEVLP